MAFFISLCLAFFTFISPSFAQMQGQEGEITPVPICTYLTNRSSVTIHGSIETMAQTLNDGTSARHESNFRLEAGDRRQFCVSGPFYEGRRIALTIRTLFPLFQCLTALDQEIFLDMTQKDDDTKEYSATCR